MEVIVETGPREKPHPARLFPHFRQAMSVDVLGAVPRADPDGYCRRRCRRGASPPGRCYRDAIPARTRRRWLAQPQFRKYTGSLFHSYLAGLDVLGLRAEVRSRVSPPS